MKRIARLVIAFTLLMSIAASPASAAGTRLIVRTSGLSLIQSVCRLLGCTVNYGLGDPDGQLFLITTPNVLSLNTCISVLRLQLGIVSVEVDLQGDVMSGGSTASPPA